MTDREILNALQGLKMAQGEVLHAMERGDEGHARLYLFQLRGYFDTLPEGLAARLDQTDPEEVARITREEGAAMTGLRLQRLAERVASFAAWQQTIRAANVYRKKEGWGPLGADGWPERKEERGV